MSYDPGWIGKYKDTEDLTFRWDRGEQDKSITVTSGEKQTPQIILIENGRETVYEAKRLRIGFIE